MLEDCDDGIGDHVGVHVLLLVSESRPPEQFWPNIPPLSVVDTENTFVGGEVEQVFNCGTRLNKRPSIGNIIN